MKNTTLSLAAIVGLSGIASTAMAYEAGDILVRGRIAHVQPLDDSDLLHVPALGGAVPDSGVTVNSDTIPELDFTYMLAPHWGVELILGYSNHDVKASGSAADLGLGKVIDAKALPPTLTLQYHFLPNAKIRPYIGAGVNYTYFFDEKVTGPLDQPGAKIKMDDSLGFAAQAGVDFAINNDWFVNLDVKWIDMETTAHFTGTTAGSAKIDVDVDPIIWSVGIGRRF